MVEEQGSTNSSMLGMSMQGEEKRMEVLSELRWNKES